MIFYLGAPEASWLGRAGVPLCVSRRRIERVKRLPRARAPWVLDSGAFSEIAEKGRWTVGAAAYARFVQETSEAIGRPDWAAVQDYMCEPFIVAKTGLSVERHQELTVDSYLTLSTLARDVSWLPVLQGWETRDYLKHADLYARRGVELATLPTVGLGSVCRRQGTEDAGWLIRRLTWDGIRLHGFGFKVTGLRRFKSYLTSADSMAWSYRARREGRSLCGAPHKTCANCLRWALAWRGQL